MAQDGVIPGHGISGPLVNLSEGGLAFRVDRVMRLDDHLRITPGLGFFERGKSFPLVKVRDLPDLRSSMPRVLANAQERNGGIILGLQFLDLREAEFRELRIPQDIPANICCGRPPASQWRLRCPRAPNSA
ncbi:MAG: PilZ domain-containing protein, partial [Holophagaceae bacterium]|nr:PilZ domain-containing protein [Holophagaceae bacterium]